MKNVGNVRGANFLQINHEVRKMFAEEGVILMSSPEAYRKLEWTRKHFCQKPSEGYFIWVKKQTGRPISTCYAISSPEVFQNPLNLVIVEEGVRAEVYSVCNAVKPYLQGIHAGITKVILRKNSTLKMRSFHKWGEHDNVSTNLNFILEKGSAIFSFFKSLNPPKKFRIENKTVLDSFSSANFETAVLSKNGDTEMYDSILLEGERSRGSIKLIMVSDKNSRIISHSKITATGAGRGHINCMGLMLSENSSINSMPELYNKNMNAILTHEAFIGRISEEELNYLRSRGLTEDEAVSLIVTGFLGETFTFMKR